MAGPGEVKEFGHVKGQEEVFGRGSEKFRPVREIFWGWTCEGQSVVSGINIQHRYG